MSALLSGIITPQPPSWARHPKYAAALPTGENRHGMLDVTKANRISSIRSLGIDHDTMLSQFGYGKPTGSIDPRRDDGRFPSRAWKQRVRHKASVSATCRHGRGWRWIATPPSRWCAMVCPSTTVR
ncbi:hypothetical protein KCP76_20945 [Salmonella enterica subsp. enterica serovar Weltevreden]|nr:hypothetical protein KCP76_20945 [Salmonella enterica subsp. enterica serovar Weltevreden]